MAILVIHGGAGGDGPWLGKTPLDPARIDSMRQVLQTIGAKLESGELDCLEAVTLAVEMLEDEPLFNAGPCGLNLICYRPLGTRRGIAPLLTS